MLGIGPKSHCKYGPYTVIQFLYRYGWELPNTVSVIQRIKTRCIYVCTVWANPSRSSFLQGYVAYRSRVVVLAKTDAFPDLKLVHLADPFSLG
jgi:hypothetical protein